MRLTFQLNQTTRQSLRFEISAGVNKPVQLVSPITGVLLSPKMPLARRATWPENLCAILARLFSIWRHLGCECTDVLSPPSLSPIYIVNELEATRKRSGNYFISLNSSIISNSNGVGI